MLFCLSLTVYIIAHIALGVSRLCATLYDIVRQLLGTRFVPGRVSKGWEGRAEKEFREAGKKYTRAARCRCFPICCLRNGALWWPGKRMICPWMVFFVAGRHHAFPSFFDSLHYSTYWLGHYATSCDIVRHCATTFRGRFAPGRVTMTFCGARRTFHTRRTVRHSAKDLLSGKKLIDKG